MGTATYTVADSNYNVIRRGLELQQAADEILTYDSRGYEVRPEEDGTSFGLWISGPHSSRMEPTTVFGFSSDRATAEAEIYRKVVGDAGYWGCVCATDEAWDAFQAEA